MGLITEQQLDNEFHEQFWSNFRDYLHRNNSSLKPFDNLFDPYDSYDGINSYSGFYLGDIEESSTLWLIAWIRPGGSRIASKLRIDADGESMFEKLKADQDSIQECFGEVELKWDDPPRFSVGVYQDDVDFTDPFIYKELFEWLHINLEKIERVFNNRLAVYFLQESS